MRNDEILRALQAAAKEAVIASSLPDDFPIAPVKIDFVKPQDKKFLELIFIPNDPDDRYWSGDQMRAGMFRMSLHWPRGHEVYKPMRHIAEIAGYFDKENTYGGVKLQQQPKIDSPLDNPDEIMYPSTIYYYTP